MIEIAAAVSIASSAYNGIRRAMDAGKEAQEIIGVFSRELGLLDDQVRELEGNYKWQ